MKNLGSVLRVAGLLIAGVSVGMMSAERLTGYEHGLFAVRSGPWIVWPDAAGPMSDPYSRGHFLNAGRLPVNGHDRLEYTALRDSAGDVLDADCDYQVSGPAPLARGWSLRVFPADSLPGTPPVAGIESRGAVYEPDGRIVLALSSEPQPGNWLDVTGGRLMLRLTLTSPPAAMRADAAAAVLPQIERGECR